MHESFKIIHGLEAKNNKGVSVWQSNKVLLIQAIVSLFRSVKTDIKP